MGASTMSPHSSYLLEILIKNFRSTYQQATWLTSYKKPEGEDEEEH